jgi:hypothetical protein
MKLIVLAEQRRALLDFLSRSLHGTQRAGCNRRMHDQLKGVSIPSCCIRYLRIAAVQLRTTVSGAATVDFGGVAATRKRCPSLVTA